MLNGVLNADNFEDDVMKPPHTNAEEDHTPVLPGLKPVLELLAADPGRIETLFVRKGLRSAESARLLDLCRQASVRFCLVDDAALDRLCAAGRKNAPRGQHQGVVARLAGVGLTEYEDMLASVTDAPLPLLLALDQVQDPGNVGTLSRTLYALGGAGLVLPRHNSAYLGAAARRSAAGALERLPVASVTNLAQALDLAEEAGLTIVGAAMGHGSQDAFTMDLPLPAVLVLGNEDKGLRPGVAKRCAHLVHIPFRRNFDSLNVAQAGAILTALWARQAR